MSFRFLVAAVVAVSLNLTGCGGSETGSTTTADPCDGIDCGAGGQCNEGSCQCNDGYELGGENTCIATLKCTDVDCGPGGSCSAVDGDRTGDYICTCADGYEGGGVNTPCSEIAEECEGVDCGPGGICSRAEGAATPGAAGYAGGRSQYPMLRHR